MRGCCSLARMVPSRRKRSWPERPTQRQVQQLDGGTALEAPVAAFGEPHAARAALAERFEQAIRAHDLTGQRRRRDQAGIERDAVEELLVADLVVFGQPGRHVGRERGIAAAERSQPGGAAVRREVERLVEARRSAHASAQRRASASVSTDTPASAATA